MNMIFSPACFSLCRYLYYFVSILFSLLLAILSYDLLQCKITVPKMGSIQDLCTAVSSLLKVAPDKVKCIFICLFSYCSVEMHVS